MSLSLKLDKPLLFSSKTPEEFPFFKLELILLLRSQELYDEILSPRLASMRPDDTNPLFRSNGYKSTTAKDAKALLLIMQSLDKTLRQSMAQQCKGTAKELWDALCARFERDTEQQKQSLHQALERIKLKEDESMSDYVGRLMNIFSRLAAVGSEVSADSQRLHFINGLSGEYKALIDTLNVSAANQSLDVWIRHAEDKYEKLTLEREQKKKEETARLATERIPSEEEEKAAYVQVNSSNNGAYRGGGVSGFRGGFAGRRGGYRGRGRFTPYNNNFNYNRGRNYNNNNNNNNQNNFASSAPSQVSASSGDRDMRSIICYTCHKPGHFARDCRTRPANGGY